MSDLDIVMLAWEPIFDKAAKFSDLLPGTDGQFDWEADYVSDDLGKGLQFRAGDADGDMVIYFDAYDDTEDDRDFVTTCTPTEAKYIRLGISSFANARNMTIKVCVNGATSAKDKEEKILTFIKDYLDKGLDLIAE